MITHLDEKNKPRMVDVSDKDETTRVAIASGRIFMSKEAFLTIINNTAKKGPVLQTAIISAIMGAKKTSDIIPMCHPIFLSSVSTNIEEDYDSFSFKLTITAKTQSKTGVEMEALTGVSIGLLTIYDMVKAIDKGMVLKDIRLEFKDGGKSGRFEQSS